MKNKLYFIFSILFCIATLFMGVGYASINSITLNVNGEIIAQAQDGIFITEVKYLESAYADINNSKIINANQNNLQSRIVLEKTSDAYITYQVTIYNSTNYDYEFERIKSLKCADNINCDTYTNNNIQVIPSITKGEIINAKKYLTFNITFSYSDLTNINNTVLESVINFLFTEVNKTYLVNGLELNAKIKNIEMFEENITSADKVDNTTTKVVFGKYENYSEYINWENYESFIDEEKLGKIRLYRLNENNNTVVYILSKVNIYANPDSSHSFQNLRALQNIIFDNFDTTDIEDISNIFYMYSYDTSDYESSLISLDLTKWNTYNVTDMADAFGYNYKLKYLNISTWETANCTNMAYMFQELRSLPEFNITNFDTSKVTDMTAMFRGATGAKELDLSSFDTNNVTNIYTMFSGKNQFTVFDYDTLLEKIYVSEKFTVANVTDKTQKVFEGNYNIVGGNGTKYSEDRINVNYAIIDNAIYDENGNYISGEQGYFTKKE